MNGGGEVEGERGRALQQHCITLLVKCKDSLFYVHTVHNKIELCMRVE